MRETDEGKGATTGQVPSCREQPFAAGIVQEMAVCSFHHGQDQDE